MPEGEFKVGRNYRWTSSTPFKARFPAAWALGSGRDSEWQRYCKNQGEATGEFYRPSYAMMNPFEVERLADVCLHLMDCYQEGGSHHHKSEAAEGYIRAQAAAISWLSR